MTVSAALSWHRRCPACQADRPQILHLNALASLDDLDLSYQVCRCAQCGFHYAADLPSPATYDRYYRDLSKYDLPGSGDLPSPLERYRSAAALALCRPHLPPEAVIADIGCGHGALLQAFKEAGHSRLHGLDPAPASAAGLGVGRIVQGYIGEAAQKLPLHELNLICLTGILEHLPQLHRDMAALTAALPAHTRLLIEVPALERFARPDSEPFGEFSLEHIQYFSRQSLSRLMAALGYEPLASDIVALDGASDSLFGLFGRARNPRPEAGKHEDPAASPDTMAAYLELSRQRLAAALELLLPRLQTPFAIYGAGSHSARLIPALAGYGVGEAIALIVDANPNLQGKHLGDHPILPPAALAAEPQLPVLVSSYRAQAAIAAGLRAHVPQRPLLLLYPND